MNTLAEVLTWVGRIWAAVFLLGVLVIFASLAYGAIWDRRHRGDVEVVRRLARSVFDDGPDAATVERIKARVVREARESGYVR